MESSIGLGKVFCNGDSIGRNFEDPTSGVTGRMSAGINNSVVRLDFEQAGEQKHVDFEAKNPGAAEELIIEERVAVDAINVALNPPETTTA